MQAQICRFNGVKGIQFLHLISFFVWLPIWSLSASDAASTSYPEDELKTCWNQHYSPEPSTFGGWIEGKPASTYLADVWWSRKSSGLQLTVFTMASLDRLSMVEAQCYGYRGPLSAALYLAVVVDTNQTEPAGPGTAGDSPNSPKPDTQRRRAWARRSASARGGSLGPTAAVTGPDVKAAVAVVESQNQAELAKARALVQAMYDRVDEQRALNSSCCCELRVMLFVERTADRQLAAIMPTNAMRNAARLPVQTPLAAMFDVDLGTSSNFSNLVEDPKWLEFVMDPTGTGEPVLRILPAWESNNKLDNNTAYLVTDAALKGSKMEVAALWDNNTLEIFHFDGCRQCHGAIHHNRWATSEAPYFVDYLPFFEPWGILRREEDPGYDERFRGWCFDKIQHVEAMGRLFKYKMVILPDAWLVHRPHDKVAIAAIAKPNHYGNQAHVNESEHYQAMTQLLHVNGGHLLSAYQYYRARVDSIFRAERNMVNASQYDPHLNPQFKHCRQVLSWWQGVGVQSVAPGPSQEPAKSERQGEEQLSGDAPDDPRKPQTPVYQA